MQPQKTAPQGATGELQNPFAQVFASMPFEPWSVMAGPMLFWTNYAQQSLATASAIRQEWQSFVQKRTERDMNTLSKLMSARTPQEYLTTYADFWKLAAEDYQKEVSEISHLYGTMVENSSAAMQDAAKRSARERWCESDQTRH